MRLIRHLQHFSTVSSLIRSAQSKIKSQQGANLIFFEKLLKKVQLQQVQYERQLEPKQRYIMGLPLLGTKPTQTIGKYFLRESSQFCEHMATEAWVALCKAYRISQIDNSGTLDLASLHLFYREQFLNILEEVKFGLKEHRMSWENTLKIGEGCVTMGYADEELYNLLVDELHLLLKPQYLTPYQHRPYQAEKQGYIDQFRQPVEQSILQSRQFKEALKMLKERALQVEFVYSEGKEINKLDALAAEINKVDKNMVKVIEGILTVRQGYWKMVKMSKEDIIQRKPAINLELLQLQEQLLFSKLINIQDIKHPELIDNQEHEEKRCNDVLTHILDLPNLEDFHFLQYAPKKKLLPSPDERILAKTSAMMKVLCGIAHIDRKVYHSKDGLSLITLEWQKTLVKTATLEDQAKEQLYVSRPFRKLYRETLTLFEQLQHTIVSNEQTDAKGLREYFSIFASYVKMGLPEHVISRMKNISVKDLQSLSEEETIDLIAILNTVGQKVNIEKIKREVLKLLEREKLMEDIGERVISTEHAINCVNLLYQHNLAPKLQLQYVQLIARQTREMHNKQIRDPITYQAYRILALCLPNRYLQSKIYQEYVRGDLQRNPYLTGLKDVCKGILLKNLNEDVHLLPAGFDNVNMRKRVLLITGADDSNVKGTVRNGNLNAYIKRIESTQNVTVVELPINTFVELSSTTHDKFIVKSNVQLHKTFEKLIGDSKKPVFILTLREFIHKNKLKINTLTKMFNKIQIQCNRLSTIYNNSSADNTIEQQMTKISETILLLIQLKKDLLFLQNKKIFGDEIAQRMKQIDQEIKKQKQIMNDYREVWRKKALKFEILQIAKFEGVRYSLQKLNQKPILGNLAYQMLDNVYYLDKHYFEYNDWTQRLKQAYNIQSYEFQHLSDMGKVLVRKFLGREVYQINKLPYRTKNEEITILNLNPSALAKKNSPTQYFINENTAKQHLAKKMNKLQQQTRRIINLMNFKHNLKTNLTRKDLLKYLMQFQFIDKMSQFNNSVKIENLIERDDRAYYDYLQNKHSSAVNLSPNIHYAMEKMMNVENLKALFVQRQQTRENYRSLYRNGKITRARYFHQIKVVEDLILQEAEKLKQKQLDHMKDNILDGGLKVVSLNVADISAVRDWFARFNTYERQTDIWYACAESEVMRTARCKAQSLLPKFKLLYRLGHSCVQPKDIESFRNWINSCQIGFHEHQIQSAFTSMRVKDLSERDVNHLASIESSLALDKELPIIQIVFEIAQFLDDKIITDFETQIKTLKLENQYNIPPVLFNSSKNVELSAIFFEQERTILDTHSQMKAKDIDHFIQMAQVFKVESFQGRQRFTTKYAQFKPTIEKMNEQQIRNQLCVCYIEALDQQFFTEYNSKMLSSHKSNGANLFWDSVMKKNQSECKSTDIARGIQLLGLRVMAMGDNPPPYFGRFVLNVLKNNKTPYSAKEHLIACIETGKVKLHLDTSDIEQLTAWNPNIAYNLHQLKQRAQQVCVKNVPYQLYNILSQHLSA